MIDCFRNASQFFPQRSFCFLTCFIWYKRRWSRWLWRRRAAAMLQSEQPWEAAGPGEVGGWADAGGLRKPAPAPSPPVPAPGGSSQLRSAAERRRAASRHGRRRAGQRGGSGLRSASLLADLRASRTRAFREGTRVWTRSKCICNNRQLSGKYKRRSPEVSEWAIRLKHC